MKLVAYLRVSSASQIEAWGLDRQEAAIRKWARSNGHKIAEWCRDEGVSGTVEALDRPGMSCAIDALRSGTAQGLVVADLDRFARALTVQEAALGVIWRLGASVFTATSGEVLQDDPNDPARTLIRQVLGAVIEYEKAQVVGRLRGGRDAKAAAGRKAVGAYAFGTQAVGSGRELDAGPRADEQPAVARIVELRKAGRSYREIAATLDAEGLRPRRAASWSAMVVRSVALREGAA